MEQNVFLSKIIGVVVAFVVLAVVLVPICNELTEGDGDSEGGEGSAPEGAQLFRPVTADDVIVFSTLDGGNGMNVTVNEETVYDLTKPASPVPILYSDGTCFGYPWNDANNPSELVEFTFKILVGSWGDWAITYPSVADSTIADEMYFGTTDTMHFYVFESGSGPADEEQYDGTLRASMSIGPEEFDCFNIQYIASPSGGDYYYDEASDKVVPIGGSSSDSGSDLGTAGTIIKIIPIFVILGIILASVALFYQNRKAI